jgi:hypothetical protein
LTEAALQRLQYVQEAQRFYQNDRAYT